MVIVCLCGCFVCLCNFLVLAAYSCYIHTVRESSDTFPTLLRGVKEIFLIELCADYKIKNKKVKGLFCARACGEMCCEPEMLPR